MPRPRTKPLGVSPPPAQETLGVDHIRRLETLWRVLLISAPGCLHICGPKGRKEIVDLWKRLAAEGRVLSAEVMPEPMA